jgi:hypothetical protein
LSTGLPRDVRQLLVHRHKQVQARTRSYPIKRSRTSGGERDLPCTMTGSPGRTLPSAALAFAFDTRPAPRFLLVEAGQTAARYDPQLQRFYRRLATRKNRGVAKVAVARKLATRLYLMLREGWTYAQLNQAVMLVSPSHSVAGE